MGHKPKINDIIRRRCVGINKIMVTFLSFIRLPLLLNWIGFLNGGEFANVGIGAIGIGLYQIVDNKYSTSEIFKGYLENIRFTISFSLITLILIFTFIIQNYDFKKSRN